jgi:hypothetical protein
MKIGIITMHKVLNFGSALQAYALQRKITELGYECEIIDYEFPPKKNKKITLGGIVDNIFTFVRALIMGFPQIKRRRRFQYFYDNYYQLSPDAYNSVSISSNPPRYDVYMTGSDQVWNPRHIGVDSNFLLSFAPEGNPKISYASSFATSHIPDEKKELYKLFLKEYLYISVREPSGVPLVKSLTGEDATVCCDPVFLLGKEQWDAVSGNAKIKVNGRYILVYALYYMFDPYPELHKIIDYVQKTLGYKVLYLNGRKEDAFRSNSSVLKSEGPSEFIKLIKNAEIVITSSFHGTAFSLIYDKPLMAIVRQNDKSDSRIRSVLDNVDAARSIISYDSECILTKNELYQLKANRAKLNQYIERSYNYLEETLSRISRK